MHNLFSRAPTPHPTSLSHSIEVEETRQYQGISTDLCSSDIHQFYLINAKQPASDLLSCELSLETFLLTWIAMLFVKIISRTGLCNFPSLVHTMHSDHYEKAHSHSTTGNQTANKYHLPSLTIILIWLERWQSLPVSLHLHGDRKEHADMIVADLFVCMLGYMCVCPRPCVRWSSAIMQYNCFSDWFHSARHYTESRAVYSQIHPECSAVGFQLSLLNTVWNRQSCHHCSWSWKIVETFLVLVLRNQALLGNVLYKQGKWHC